MLDLGAECSLVHNSLLEGLNIPYKKSITKVQWGNGSPLPHLGGVTLGIELGSTIVNHDFLVTEAWELPGQMLIGTDFTDAHRVVYDSRSRFLIVEDQKVEIVRSRPPSRSAAVAMVRGGRPAIRRGRGRTGTPVEPTTHCVAEKVTTPRSDPGGVMSEEEHAIAKADSRSWSVYPRVSHTISSRSCGAIKVRVACEEGELEGTEGSMLFEPQVGQVIGLSEGVVAVYKDQQGLFCFQIPYANERAETVDLEEGRTIGRVIGLAEDSSEEPGAVVGALHSESAGERESEDALIHTESAGERERETALLEQVDKMFPRSTREHDTLAELVREFPKVFSLGDEPLTISHQFYHEIRYTGEPVFKRSYPIALKHREEIKRQIEEMIAGGIIQPSRSPYNHPLVPIKKKDGRIRLCLDFRKLNERLSDDRYPLPRIDSLLARLGKGKMFTCLDLRQGYHQVPLSPGSREKTAFSTPDGHYEYLTLPFGLKDAPAAFQRIINQVLTGLIGDIGFVYLDDIVVMGDTWETHCDNIRRVLHRLQEANLSLKLSKCSFFKEEVEYLGHVISGEGIKPQPSKVRAMKEYPRPEILKELQGFLGVANYYRKFVPGFASIAKPLVELTKGEKTTSNKRKVVWTEKALDAFEKLKGALSQDVVLTFPNFQKAFVLVTDASKFALGGALQQEDSNGALRPLSYFSRQLKGAELNYSTVEREALAIVFGLRFNRTIIQGYPVVIHTDHKPLRYLFQNKEGSDRLARWRMAIADYDIRVEYIPGKDNVLADALSRIREADHPLDDVLVGAVTRGAGGRNNSDHAAGVAGASGKRKPQGEDHHAPIQVWTLGELKNAQDADALWNKIKQHCRGDVIISGKQKGIPGNISDYEVRSDGLLYNITLGAYGNKICRVVVPKIWQDTAVRLAHSPPISGHGGILATLERLKRFAFFPGMRRKVEDFCRACEICSRCKPGKEVPVPLLRYPEVSRPFQRVHMDLIGPFPLSGEFKYILTVVDALTKYLYTAPLKSKEAGEVARAFISSVVASEGTPSQVITDGGGEFLNEVFRTVCNLLGVARSVITPYHPSSNGQVERVNGTLTKILRTMVVDNPEIWSQMLPVATLAYNSSYHRIIKDSPFFALKHRDPTWPYATFAEEVAPWYELDNFAQELRAVGNKVFKRCQFFIEEEIARRPADRPQARPSPIREGDRVYMRAIPKPGVSKKVQPLYTGPYRVIERISEVIMRIQRLSDKKEAKCHVDRLKLEKYLRPGHAYNVGRAYPIHDCWDKEHIEDLASTKLVGTWEDHEISEDICQELKKTRPRGTGAYNLRSRK